MNIDKVLFYNNVCWIERYIEECNRVVKNCPPWDFKKLYHVRNLRQQALEKIELKHETIVI